MSYRIPPDLDPRLCSRMTLLVRFCETDLMGIVHHANYLQYFEAGRVDWLHRRGISYEIWAKNGVHLPVVETHIRYRKAARFELLAELGRRLPRTGRRTSETIPLIAICRCATNSSIITGPKRALL